MLRLLAGALLIANLLYLGWTMGWLDSVVGVRADGGREPERLARQVRPELIQLQPADAPASATVVALAPASAPAAAGVSALAPSSAPASASATSSAPSSAAAATPASAPTRAAAVAASPASAAAPNGNLLCLEAGPFAAADLPAAEKLLQGAWPGGTWTRRRIDGNDEWLIYMGPYPDDAWLERKKGELSRIRGGLSYEVLRAPPALARGISLGRFASQAAAEQRLDQLRQRGIRTAKVVRSGNGPDATMLQIAEADTAVAARLAALKWPSGKAGFSACAKPR